MSRIELSMYLTDDIVNLIQKKLLPDKSNYTFLDELRDIKKYSMCFVCKRVKTILPVKLLLKIRNFSKKDDLEQHCTFYYYCNDCYPFFIMGVMKNQIYLKQK